MNGLELNLGWLEVGTENCLKVIGNVLEFNETSSSTTGSHWNDDWKCHRNPLEPTGDEAGGQVVGWQNTISWDFSQI